MIIIPAIDLLDGQCVRLKQGREQSHRVYSEDPVAIAQKWQSDGAELLHLVNLDGAFGRAEKNRTVIAEIIRRSSLPIQLGGGIRTISDIAHWLDLGATRVILGTVAVTSPIVVQDAVRNFGAEKIVVGLDARNGAVAIEGWKNQTDRDVFHAAADMEKLGVVRIVYTDVSRDGLLKGPDLTTTLQLADQTALRVIASGGFSRPEHFLQLHALGNQRIEGVIVGTALYEGHFELSQLITLLRSF